MPYTVYALLDMFDISDICDIDRRSRDESELTFHLGPSQQYDPIKWFHLQLIYRQKLIFVDLWLLSFN
jgi:hypothetical protein